jgi:hypothetical protein
MIREEVLKEWNNLKTQIGCFRNNHQEATEILKKYTKELWDSGEQTQMAVARNLLRKLKDTVFGEWSYR